MKVDDETGKVFAYTNYATQDAKNDDSAGMSISKASALSIAKQAMAAAGHPTDTMVLEWILEEQGHDPPTASMHKLNVAWLRTYQGIPFRREGGGVIMEAETGDVISVGIGYPSIDPVSNLENISLRQGMSIAEAQLTAVGLPLSDLPLLSTEKEIVPFNTYWQNGDEIHRTLQTRIVWNYHFGSPSNTFEIWVDTETGDVIGGYNEASLGRGVKMLTPKFGHQLKHSETLTKTK